MLNIFFIIIGVILRLLPHIPNVAPITAIALFGGAYLNKKTALVIPLVTMIISDIFLGFHVTMPFVYMSFLLSGLLGLWLRKRKNVKNLLYASLFSSFLFFLITNGGVWIMTTLYPHTFDGLLQAYIMGLPFFRYTVLGDLAYTGLFFGSYEFVRIITLRTASIKEK